MMDNEDSSFNFLEAGNYVIAELKRESEGLRNLQLALDLMAEAAYAGAPHMIVQADQLPNSFFDLSSKIAGEILQKFAQYQVRLAIIGDFAKFESQALKAFIAESNRGDQIFFVADKEQAINRLSYLAFPPLH
jgi:hypothetical protein